MYLDLKGLEGFSFQTNSTSAYAFVENSKLHIKGNVSFEKLMFTMAYRKYGNVCYYCGKKLKKSDKTIDHKIPSIFGGVSILTNIVPSCKSCNEEKSNLKDDEYKTWKTIDDCDEKKRYRLRAIGSHERQKILRGSILPREWLQKEKSKIYVDINVEDSIKGKKYSEAEEFLLKFGKIIKPIIISNNNILLDGFISMWLAKNEHVEKVPIIKLENVIVD